MRLLQINTGIWTAGWTLVLLLGVELRSSLEFYTFSFSLSVWDKIEFQMSCLWNECEPCNRLRFSRIQGETGWILDSWPCACDHNQNARGSPGRPHGTMGVMPSWSTASSEIHLHRRIFTWYYFFELNAGYLYHFLLPNLSCRKMWFCAIGVESGQNWVLPRKLLFFTNGCKWSMFNAYSIQNSSPLPARQYRRTFLRVELQVTNFLQSQSLQKYSLSVFVAISLWVCLITDCLNGEEALESRRFYPGWCF